MTTSGANGNHYTGHIFTELHRHVISHINH